MSEPGDYPLMVKHIDKQKQRIAELEPLERLMAEHHEALLRRLRQALADAEQEGA